MSMGPVSGKPGAACLTIGTIPERIPSESLTRADSLFVLYEMLWPAGAGPRYAPAGRWFGIPWLLPPDQQVFHRTPPGSRLPGARIPPAVLTNGRGGERSMDESGDR